LGHLIRPRRRAVAWTSATGGRWNLLLGFQLSRLRLIQGRAAAMQQISQDQAASWYHGKQFTFDWTSYHFPSWFGLLKKFRSRKARVLEIGSWEGRSAIFFLNYLPRCTVVCVDSFLGGREHLINRGSPRFLRSVEKRFDSNIAEFGDRVEKIRASSADALAQLGLQGRRFDFAYIDGSHVAADPLTRSMCRSPGSMRS
jgi:Methyltransferase domain